MNYDAVDEGDDDDNNDLAGEIIFWRFFSQCAMPPLLPIDTRAEQSWDLVRPDGLCVMDQKLREPDQLLEFYSTVEWFQRFGTQYPNTAHYNGHHCMATDHPAVHEAVVDAISIARAQCSHKALTYMAENMHDVSVATMRHKGAERALNKRGTGTKLVKHGWGLGRHPDTWAPDGEGLVLMICVADTQEHHREFMFTCPPLGQKWLVTTPNATVLVFYGDAYDMWEHESIRSKFQDGECISLTVRIKSIDAYYGWTTNLPDLGSTKRKRDDTTSVGFARLMQHERIRKKFPHLVS